MTNEKFKIGKTYTGEEIKKVLGSGSYMQVIVFSEKKEILCIRFRSDLNPNWKNKKELWIHHGDRRIPDAKKWVESGVLVPIFCGMDRTNNWTYQGEASASLLADGEAATSHCGDSNVGLVIQMDFKNRSKKLVKHIRRASSAANNGKNKAA